MFCMLPPSSSHRPHGFVPAFARASRRAVLCLAAAAPLACVNARPGDGPPAAASPASVGGAPVHGAGAGAVPAAPLPRTLAPQPTVPAVTERDLMTRVYIYAADSMEGRAAGTPGSVRATAYIARELQRLGLEPAGDDGTFFQAVPSVKAEGQPAARNVVAVLRGGDPALRGQYVALGAHSDHIGVRRGGPVDHDSARAYNAGVYRFQPADQGEPSLTREQRTSIRVNVDSLRRLRPARPDSINNGADDDGSGSMALLEIAEALATSDSRPRRSVLFVWHTAEELGLVGSNHFTKNPTVPRDSIVAQINIDMIGRGGADDTRGGGPDFLSVVGSRRLSTELGDLAEQVNASSAAPLRLDYTLDANGHPTNIYCRSDHYMYARYGIPVAFLFTGVHRDYHEVTDEPQYLDYAHYARITRFVHDLTRRVAELDRRPRVDGPKPDPAGSCQQ
jgi:hypothetical protein